MVNNETLSVDVFDAIKTKISNASLVPTSETLSIGASYNDKITNKPQVVIYPALTSEDTYKYGSKEGKKLINVVVDVYAQSTLKIDQIMDGIKNTLKDNDITNISLNSIEEDYAFNSPGDNKYHLKSATFTFIKE